MPDRDDRTNNQEGRRSYNDAADAFVDDMANRNARHMDEAGARWATVQQLAVVQTDVKSLRETIEGRVDGVNRIPGVVDVTASIIAKTDNIQKLLYGIGALLLGNLAVEIVKNVGIIK